MLFVSLFINVIRLPENNDWVVYILLLCTALYLFLMNVLQRDASIKSYLLQDLSETNNVSQTWMIIGVINTLLVATIISQYIPVVPQVLENLQINGYQLNKFGFALLAVSAFYLAKSVFSFLYFQTLGVGRNWKMFCYASSKFYFLLSLLLVIICFMHYYFGMNFNGHYFRIDSAAAFPIYLFSAFILLSFKNFYYLITKTNILPFSWYYKILYICTLQIAPVLALWKLLFI